MLNRISRWLRPVIGTFALGLTVTTVALAQGSFSLAPPTIGQSNVADADPPVLRPTTTPCKVQLFTNLKSSGSTQYFNYAPPADCAGPWSKIVFVGDFGVTGTNQFDRTAQIQIGNTMIYYGTTQEPSPTAQPTWHVESDVTDYASLFKTADRGEFELANYIEGPYCCYQYASAYLQFYPADSANPAPKTADQVIPIPAGAGAQGLNTFADHLSRKLTLPQNIEKAYLDVWTQGQSNDEFWWSCIPNNALPILGAEYNCGNSSFRQAEVQIDGQMAGLAPIIPYVFTGGVDPDFWRPIPGVQTLNFKPYRLDLTPFAGSLDDGQPHTITVSVYDANSYFLADATLLLFQDWGSKVVTGKLTGNTIGITPTPTLSENLDNYATTYTGSITVTDEQSYLLSGYVNTSHGQVGTTVVSQLSFKNAQYYTALTEVVEQLTQASREVTTTEGGSTYKHSETIKFPFEYSFSEAVDSKGNGSETLGIKQQLIDNVLETTNGNTTYASTTTDQVAPIDTLQFSGNNLTGEPVDTNTELYTFIDTAGHCWNRSVTASDTLVSAVSDGAGCPDGMNQW
jgi:hypothetical protein